MMLVKAERTDLQLNLCDQRRLRLDCAFAQSDQSSLVARAFYSLQAIQGETNENPFAILSGCTSWFESLLDTRLIVGFVVAGSYDKWTFLPITKTCLYNIEPLKRHFYTVKLGFTGVYIIFLISA